MIITQTHQNRHFMGCMNPGTEIVEGLTQICIDNSIFCGQFSGVGYIRNPRLVSYNEAARGFDPPVGHEGTFHVVALHGNVSLQDRQTVFRTHVIGTLRDGGGDERLLSGELVGGEVLSFEFSLTTVDDLRLYRAEDDRTGLDPWLHMDLGEGPPRPPEAPLSGRGAHPAPSALPVDEPVDVDEGDWLDHPTLGTCRVVEADEDDHLTIELESGRRVVVNLAVLTLAPAGRHEDGGHIFAVRVKRRR